MTSLSGVNICLYFFPRGRERFGSILPLGEGFLSTGKKKRETILKHLLAKEKTHKGGFVTIYTYLKYCWSFCTYFG